MCGITGIHFKNPRDMGVGRDNMEQFVNELLLGIEPRGRDATGLLTVDSRGRTKLVKADMEASKFIHWRDPMPRRVRTVLGHTRFATQGSPMNLDNNHPVQSGTCYAIHNGHISNDSELFREFSLGREAEVDSEIIPALFNMMGLDKARDALELLDGNYAVAAVDPERFPNMTILAKGWSSPVEVYENKYAVVWASASDALKEAVRSVFNFDLPDRNIESLALGEMLVMEGDTVERLRFKPLVKPYRSTSYSSTSTSFGRYSGSREWDEGVTGETFTEVNDFFQDECASCGCERIYHGSGNSFTGSCQYITMANFRCRCVGFKVAPPLEDAASQQAWEACDGCGREYFMGDLVQVGTKFLCPDLCADDPAVKPTVTALPAVDLRKRAEDIISRSSLYDTASWDDEAMNEHTCALASAKTGQAPAYINWLVNEMESELAEKDSTGFLTEARRVAGKAFYDAWLLLEEELAEINSVFSLDDACDTESDEEICGVIVNVEDTELVV